MSPPSTRIDLHSHTTFSDGVLTPTALVQRAASAGVTHLAVTDHDTVAGIAEAASAAPPGFHVVPGLEASATFHGRECHILALLICPVHPPLADWCRRRETDRLQRIEEMIAVLRGRGVSVTLDEVIAESGGHTLARPHLARVLVKRGLARTLQDAFDRYLTRRDIVDVGPARPSAEEVIALIREWGGVSSIAHPGVNRISEAELKTLAEMGLDAVEASHPEHVPTQRGAYERWAASLRLNVTGGSDFHGGPVIASELGGFCAAPAHWKALEEKAQSKITPSLRASWAAWLSATFVEKM